MALDPGPLVALAAGGAIGALMRWARPALRAWRERLPGRLRLGLLLGGVVAAGGLAAWSATADPEQAWPWLEQAVEWARHDGGNPFVACPQGDGADRPAVALVRAMSAGQGCGTGRT